MSNREITALLARCLLEPEFLEELKRDPVGALAAAGAPPEDAEELRRLDFQRLERFSGFVAKVKHNHLWESFPYTRVLMRRFGFELGLFAEYRRSQGGQAGPASRDEKIRRFIDFVQRRLEKMEGAESALLRDVAVHERFRWELIKLARRRPAGSQAIRRGPRNAVPVLKESVRLECFLHHPLEIIADVHQRRLEIAERTPRRRWLAYRLDSGRQAEQIEIFEMDEASAALLRQLDGHRSLAQMALQAPLQKAAELRDFFRQAEALGLVEWIGGGPAAEGQPGTVAVKELRRRGGRPWKKSGN